MIITKIPEQCNVSCVYMMKFGDESFYIGSTKNMRVRLTHYRYTFNNPIRLPYKVYLAFSVNTKVSFSIIEVTNKAISKKRENVYIKQYWGNNNLLNTSSDAFKSIGRRGRHQHRFKFIKNTFSERKLKVTQYSINGDFVFEHDSVTSAAKAIRSTSGNVCAVLKGKRSTAKGFIFKYSE